MSRFGLGLRFRRGALKLSFPFICSPPAIVLALHVTYTPAYPDELPEMEIEEVDGELGEEGKQELMRQLREVVSGSWPIALGGVGSWSIFVELTSARSAGKSGKYAVIRGQRRRERAVLGG